MTHVETDVSHHVVANAVTRAPVHVSVHAKLNVVEHVNMDVLVDVRQNVLMSAQDVVETVRIHVKADAWVTLEMHQIHVAVVPHVHQRAVFRVGKIVLKDVVEVVAICAPLHAPTLVWVIALALPLVQ